MSETESERLADAWLKNLFGQLEAKGIAPSDAWNLLLVRLARQHSLEHIFPRFVQSPTTDLGTIIADQILAGRRAPTASSPLRLWESRLNPPDWTFPMMIQVTSRMNSEETIVEHLAAQSLGLNLDEVPLHRVLPVDLYLEQDDPHAIAAVETALLNLITESGFEVIRVFPAEAGSYRRRLVVRTREPHTKQRLHNHLANLESVLAATASNCDSERHGGFSVLLSDSAPEEKAGPEALKAKAEAAKAIAEACTALIKAVRDLTFGAALLIGTISITSHPANSGPSIVDIARTTAVEAFNHWVQPQKTSTEHSSTEASREAGAE